MKKDALKNLLPVSVFVLSLTVFATCLGCSVQVLVQSRSNGSSQSVSTELSADSSSVSLSPVDVARLVEENLRVMRLKESAYGSQEE